MENKEQQSSNDALNEREERAQEFKPYLEEFQSLNQLSDQELELNYTSGESLKQLKNFVEERTKRFHFNNHDLQFYLMQKALNG